MSLTALFEQNEFFRARDAINVSQDEQGLKAIEQINEVRYSYKVIKVKNMGCGSVSEGRVTMPAPLNNIYRRLELIGTGTFGKVYKCQNQLNGLIYALKVVEITANTREEAFKQIENLKRQIKVLKKLNHPNIVKYYSFDISPDNQQVEIVLEYAEGGSLKHYLTVNGPLPEMEASDKTKQILEGLAYLHQQNIVHRDLKCANILVMADGTLKITDFGTAKLLKDSGTPAKNQLKSGQHISDNPSLKGTPYYMAPEILRRTGHTLSADIWSLGCLVIQMLSGKAPWTSLTSDFKEIIGYILSGIHPPHPKGLTDDCQNFLSSCLQNIPIQRPNCLELISHRWIARSQGESLSKYKKSLSKTNDDYEQLYQERIASKAGLKAGRQQKMRQIDNYLFQKAKTREKQPKRPKEKDKNRQSAKPKRDRTANLIYSDKQISGLEEQLDVVNCGISEEPQPLSRKLFVDEPMQNKLPAVKKLNTHVQTAPVVKLPQFLVSQIKKLQQQQIECDLGEQVIVKETDQPVGTRIKTEHSSRDDVIDTMISRQERARFLEQQRALRQQRQEQKRKWERELKQGANYLRKEINSRYIA